MNTLLAKHYQQNINERIQWVNKKKVSFLLVTIILIVFLAFSRWIPGGDNLNPTTSNRGYIEIFMSVLALGASLFIWGSVPFFKGIRNSAFISLFILGIWALISSTWSESILLATGKSATFLLMVFIAVAIAYTASQHQIPISKPILVALLVLIFIQIINNKYIYHEFLPIRDIGGRARLVLGFDHPNLSASYFSSAIIISLNFYLIAPKIIDKLVFLLLSGILFVFVVLSNSRTDLISLCTCIVISFLSAIKSKHLKWIILLTLGIFLLLVVFLMLSGIIDNFLISIFQKNPDLITLNGRTVLWSRALTQAKSKIIMGIGYYSSRFLSIEDLNISWGTHLHNSFLEILMTTGLIGSLFSFGFITLSLYNASVQKFQLSITYLIYVMITSLTETRLFVPSIVMFITCLLVFQKQHAFSRTIHNGK